MNPLKRPSSVTDVCLYYALRPKRSVLSRTVRFHDRGGAASNCSLMLLRCVACNQSAVAAARDWAPMKATRGAARTTEARCLHVSAHLRPFVFCDFYGLILKEHIQIACLRYQALEQCASSTSLWVLVFHTCC